jgi:flagellar biosynthetic protein FliP
MLLMGLALFLTYFVMEPTFTAAWSAGVAPWMAGEIEPKVAAARILDPFRGFMEGRVDADAIVLLAEARGAAVAEGPAPFSLLAPAFVLSEIQRAFEIGFVILLPFLIIDLLIASVLMAMGMMMVPPAIVSLPFKLAFCVLTNGWIAISAALVRSYQ